MNSRKQTRVVAALIEREGKILISRRFRHAANGGKWEFPGGKVELGERDEVALSRELREELGCESEIGELVTRILHAYPDFDLELLLYRCKLPPAAEPRPLGMEAIEWAAPSDLARFDFCEADVPLLPGLASLASSK